MLIITYNGDTSAIDNRIVTFGQVDNKYFYPSGICGNYLTKRAWTTTPTGLTFNKALKCTSYPSTWAIDNTLMIPYQVFGIKKSIEA